MTDKRRIALVDAERLAAELGELLSPACERLEIAGSIRRRRPDPADIELVCIPKLEAETDMFGLEPGGSRNLLDAAVEALHEAGTLQKRRDVNGRPRWGARYKAAIYDGVALDLFAVLPPAQFGTILLIRTGPAEFSHRLVSDRRHGGGMPDWLRQRDGALWHRDGTVLATPNEADVFQALGLPYIEPEERTASWRPVSLGVR